MTSQVRHWRQTRRPALCRRTAWAFAGGGMPRRCAASGTPGTSATAPRMTRQKCLQTIRWAVWHLCTGQAVPFTNLVCISQYIFSVACPTASSSARLKIQKVFNDLAYIQL